MLERKIKQTLCGISQQTFPSHTTSNFTLEIIPKELRERHGDYTPLLARIRVFNLSRSTSHIVITAIHELAHHVDCVLHKKSGHDKRFYGVYKKLLETAVRTGVVTVEQLMSVCDANDINMMTRHHGPILARYDQTADMHSDSYFVKVCRAFEQKQALSAAGYRWNAIEKAWCKEVQGDLLAGEKNFLSGITTSDNISIAKFNEAKIEAVYYVIVHNGFDHRLTLKGRDYYFNGYNFTGNVWVKRLIASNLPAEKAFLSTLSDIAVAVKSA